MSDSIDDDFDPSCPDCWARWDGAHICRPEDLDHVRRYRAYLTWMPEGSRDTTTAAAFGAGWHAAKEI